MDVNVLEFSDAIRILNAQGHSPATSTNYSFKDVQNNIWVSRSGVDKCNFSEQDFILIDEFAIPLNSDSGSKASAEALIHCTIYKEFKDAKVILHSHAIYPVLLSAISQSHFTFIGYELQKGFTGVNSHESELLIPILENHQDMIVLTEEIIKRKKEIQCFSFMIRKHGFYAWGKDLSEAKKHLETLTYLCECAWNMNYINER